MNIINEKLLHDKIVAAGMTWESVADDCGIDRCTLRRRIKAGKLRICDIEKIVSLLKLTLAESTAIFLPFAVA